MRSPYSDYFEKQKTTYTLQYTQVFFKENVRYPVRICRDPISLILEGLVFT